MDLFCRVGSYVHKGISPIPPLGKTSRSHVYGQSGTNFTSSYFATLPMVKNSARLHAVPCCVKNFKLTRVDNGIALKKLWVPKILGQNANCFICG